MVNGVSDYISQIGNWNIIEIPEINTPLARFDFRVHGSKGFDMVIATRIDRNVLFLIGQGYPTFTNPIGGHLVRHIDSHTGVKIQNHGMDFPYSGLSFGRSGF